MTPELHRPVAVERVGSDGLELTVQADQEECLALAGRMKIPAVLSLACSFHLRRDTADSLLAHGRLRASVVQTCVVTLEDFTATVEERFTLRCVPEGQESDEDDPDAPDEFTYMGGRLDLGEAAAQQLALALDPYPRAPGAELPALPENLDGHPLAALATWRTRQN